MLGAVAIGLLERQSPGQQKTEVSSSRPIQDFGRWSSNWMLSEQD